MSDSIEMASIRAEKADEESPNTSASPSIAQRDVPKTWKYQPIKLLWLFQIPHYASPEVQLFLVALISFLNPGLYNALMGLGGAGQLDAHVLDLAQMALYCTFAIVAFNSGTITNVLGVRFTLLLGTLGYTLYSASLLCYNHTQNAPFVIFSGIILGWSAGLLWTAQGAVMMAYPPEGSKGRFISWFWVTFNLGAVIGSIVPLATNSHTITAKPVSDTTYIIMMVFMAVGGILPIVMCNGNEVVRSDRTWVIMPLNPTWRHEVWALWSTLRTDVYVVLLFPMFFCSNWFYTYQFNGFNLAHFNVRARALNNLLYWIAQIVGALVFGYSMDNPRLRRTSKAKLSWFVVAVLTIGIWGGGFAWQLSVPDRKNLSSPPLPVLDWSSPGYWKGMILYIAYGFFDAIWQSSVYWYIGALTNSGRKTANFAGFYKGLQSAGAAIAWRMDSLGKPYMTEFISNFILLACALVFALPVIWSVINDHIPEQEERDHGTGEAIAFNATDANSNIATTGGRSDDGRIAEEAARDKTTDIPQIPPSPREPLSDSVVAGHHFVDASEIHDFGGASNEQNLTASKGGENNAVSSMTLKEACVTIDPPEIAYGPVVSASHPLRVTHSTTVNTSGATVTPSRINFHYPHAVKHYRKASKEV